MLGAIGFRTFGTRGSYFDQIRGHAPEVKSDYGLFQLSENALHY